MTARLIALAAVLLLASALPAAAAPRAPDPDATSTATGPSELSRKDPNYSRLGSWLVNGHRSVFCWTNADFRGFGMSPQRVSGFVNVTYRPRQVNLEMEVCRQLDELYYRHRRPPPRWWMAWAVTTLAHELLHTIGYRNEAETQCIAIQYTAVVARTLGTTAAYGRKLALVSWGEYLARVDGPRYYSPLCRDGGPWDVDPASHDWPTAPASGVDRRTPH